MAGAGAKLFVSGDVLTAAQVNTYLMDQAVMVFASTSARDAAFGGAGEPTVAEGMFAYTSDTNTLWLYDGAAWVSAINAASLNGVGNWTSYTPVLTATVTNPTLGTGSVVSAAYARVKNLIIYRYFIQFGTSGVNAGSGEYKVSLPVTSAGVTNYYENAIGSVAFFDVSANSMYYGNAWLAAVDNVYPIWQQTFNGPLLNIGAASPVVPAASDALSGLIIYTAA